MFIEHVREVNYQGSYYMRTVQVDGARVHGCRITPNVYTTTDELDVLVNALTELK
jgi:selenocysteine lyase/cysteine desulfurase